MTRLVLANIDYSSHMTSEGQQLQEGLAHAGWILAGNGFGDGCRDVPQLLERYQPEAVFVSDKRDFDPDCKGSFRKDVGFTGLEVLAGRADILKLAVIKDAGSMIDYHQAFCEEIEADIAVTYYHDRSVLACSPWLSQYSMLRTYHSIDSQYVEALPMFPRRQRAIVSGAMSQVYPLRERVIANAARIGCTVLKHPGYGNHGVHTNSYLQSISQYRVHIATASMFGFALRKIIESVAVGTTPITDLPAYDVLPEIDEALVRVAPGSSVEDMREAVATADRSWDFEERMMWARKARAWYDWRAVGRRLSEEIMRLRVHA